MPIRILVVDDEKIIAESVATALRWNGYTCYSAFSCEEAMRLLESDTPDLVITDVVMPGGDGFELERLIHAQFPKCKVIFMSANAFTLNHGFTEPYIEKPFSIPDLLAIVRVTLGQ